MGLETCESRLLLSATAFSVEQRGPAPSALASDFSGTWNCTTENNGPGTIVITQDGNDAQGTVAFSNMAFTADGHVFLSFLKLKNKTVVDGLKVKEVVHAHKTGEDSFAGRAKVKVQGAVKIVDRFQGDRVPGT